jgi:hypothetical protein
VLEVLPMCVRGPLILKRYSKCALRIGGSTGAVHTQFSACESQTLSRHITPLTAEINLKRKCVCKPDYMSIPMYTHSALYLSCSRYHTAIPIDDTSNQYSTRAQSCMQYSQSINQ